MHSHPCVGSPGTISETAKENDLFLSGQAITEEDGKRGLFLGGYNEDEYIRSRLTALTINHDQGSVVFVIIVAELWCCRESCYAKTSTRECTA